MEIIDVQIGKQGQCVYFKQLLSIVGVRLLVDIKIDSVQFQSSADISRWDGARWQEVYALHPAEMLVDFKAAYAREAPTEALVASVVERLIATAEKIVFPDRTLLEFLNENCAVHGLDDGDREVLLAREGSPSRVTITLPTGNKIVAEGPFEMVEGRVKVWTPCESETFALIHPEDMKLIAYSE